MKGLSKSRLERMHQVLSGYVERKEMPGLVALVSRHDDVHVETLGTMAVGHATPMNRDTIFRIASLAKPMTAVAAMILVIAVGASEWRWTFSATKSSTPRADSVGTAASAPRPTPIRPRE